MLVRQLLENVAQPWSILVFNSAFDPLLFDSAEFRVTAAPLGESITQADASLDAVIASTSSITSLQTSGNNSSVIACASHGTA